LFFKEPVCFDILQDGFEYEDESDGDNVTGCMYYHLSM